MVVHTKNETAPILFSATSKMEKTLEEKLNIGLTADEVREKQAAGLSNGEQDIRTKTYWQIVRGNLFSLFNLVNLILFICVLIAGSPKNGLFFLIVIWNFLIGLVQEIRAKKTIEKLSLITAPKAYVLRDGRADTIQPKDIVLGDIMKLKSGNQICVDCVILNGECMVNESLITGESEPELRKTGDHLLSGSYVVSGSVTAECEHIGEENYVNRITAGAKYVKKSNSVILNSVRTVVRIIAAALIPLAALMVWKNFFVIDHGFSNAMIATVASISAMIPGGLILLVSLVMTVSVIRLSRHNTLAQDLYCVENLARVDCLCLDKTGTITEGDLRVEDIVDAGGFDIEDLKLFARSMSDENPTMEAIRSYLKISADERAEADLSLQIPFSSDIKWSLLKDGKRSIILGAPEMVIRDIPDEYKNKISEWTSASKRVVAFAVSNSLPEGRTLPGDIELKALIVIGDRVRDNAKDVLDVFTKEGVLVKVISGDNPVTVSVIAAEAGLEGADRYIDVSGLQTYDEIEKAAEEYVIFGRVTPYQKLDLIKALKAHGHTVAMIGDGANDVLALREADCSVAMQNGSDAARNVADLVLLRSEFEALPVILAEGRKTINNLQRSAGLYLTKTTYAFILTVAFLFITFAYPFQSIQVTLIGAATIGIPSFFLALEPNARRIKKAFLRNVFSMAVPSGVLTVIAILSVVLAVRGPLGGSTSQIQTAATFITLIAGFMVIFNISGKMNLWKLGLLVLVIAIAAGAVLIFPGMFDIAALSGGMWGVIAAAAAGFFLIHTVLFRIIVPKLEKNSME